ncbi:putative membrane protein, partial [Vibrio harveyi]
METDRSYFFT